MHFDFIFYIEIVYGFLYNLVSGRCTILLLICNDDFHIWKKTKAW